MERQNQVVSNAPVSTKEELSIAYTPGLRSPVRKLQKMPQRRMIIPERKYGGGSNRRNGSFRA